MLQSSIKNKVKYILEMPTPLEDHGGAIPSSDHPMRLPDVPNRLTLVVHASEPNFSMELYTSLVLNRIATIYVVLGAGASHSVPYIHPLVQYVTLETNIVDFLKTKVLTPTNPHVFVHEVTMGTPVDPSVWTALETASPGSSLQFKSSSGETQSLWCINTQGVCPLSSVSSGSVRSIQDITSTTLSELVMDVSQSYTPLCHWATRHMTDKHLI